MAKSGSYQLIDTLPGVQPATDKTAVNTQHYVYSDKIRFIDGVTKKIGGWISVVFDYSQQVVGTIRTIFSEIINGKIYTILGTDQRLYSLIGSSISNITPLQSTSTAASNSLSTHYATLAADPFQTINGSSFVTVADTEAGLFQVGDEITISGAAGFAGISSGSLNGVKLIRDIGVNIYTISVGTNATSSTTGGGASVVRSSGLLTLTHTDTVQSGDRVKISGAVTTGGILNTSINQEFIARNTSGTQFSFMTSGTATSTVTGGGGTGTVFFQQIPAGNLNEMATQGYGAGLYGSGLYGTALVSPSSRSYPRIWFCDRYANTTVLTPGNQGGVYQWMGDPDVSPQQVANAPIAVNYLFVSDNILVTFGAPDGSNEEENRIFASDQNDITNWTSSSTNQVFDDNIEGAGRLLSHCPIEDNNLVYTENQTYTFRYIGLPFIWEIKELDENIGIIAPMARVSVKGIAIWMGLENFYMYRGGVVEVIPANSQNESTCLNYVFGNLNWGQKSKIHCWYNKAFNEVWFHYPSAASNECDSVVVVNLLDFTWAIHQLSRTASEYPGPKLKTPRLANVSTLYQHELGTDDDGDALQWILKTNKRYGGRDNLIVNAIVPDSVQNGNISFMDEGFMFPQSASPIKTTVLTVTPTTERIPISSQARFHQYTLVGDELGQAWIGGAWIEEVQKGATE